ncbi:hypothetical protein NM688_g4513 [Phlebia brevispora]|uniref:Uncharacterized protein n=1 Tax=Phlebia brevispora TaxID=194682 RepID=A0ACC1T2W3_9APHY|nr:hypothetical protein NM688_g4513 [Phlebia brevispora]
MAVYPLDNAPEDWRHVAKPDVPPYDVFTRPVRKSEQDDREYRVIKLENGLEAALVQDATADKAAASLDVAVGHLSDPDDMPGLAHFCEHLLFMGTETYPRENEYSEYLAKNNGMSNAYTGTSNTNYYFNVSTHALEGALSRFAAFFHCPLFAPSCTTRELNAVNSEHKKNLQADMWRVFQLNKHLSKPGHPFGKFGSGNIESLSRAAKAAQAKGLLKNGSANGHSGSSSLSTTPESSRPVTPALSESEGDGGVIGREIRRRLVEWWSKEYSANRMRLCVIGKEPLDELSDMVSKLFSPVVNRGVEPLPMINDHPFGSNESGTLVSAQVIMSLHAVEVSFPLAYQPPLWRHKPGNFVSHFLGHEGPGSLHSYLKNKGWATALSAGCQSLGRGFAMMKATVYLTQTGFDHYREVMLAVFKYLSLLRSSPLPQWYSEEMSRISAMRFRFAEKRRPDDYAMFVAEHMGWPVPRDHILDAPQTVDAWDKADRLNGGEKEVRDLLNSLTVYRGRAVLMAKKEEFGRVRPGLEWKNEPIYGTPYHVEQFDSKFLEEAQGPNDIPELFLPGPNEFIPTNFNVDKRPVAEITKRPTLVRETPLSSLWHKKDDHFWIPRANVMLDLRSPAAYKSTRASAMTRLYSELVQHSLTEFSYDADLAGLTYNFSAHNLGIFISLSGFNDKLHVLARDVFSRARNLIIKEDELNIVRERVIRDYQNFFLSQPYRISDYFARYIMSEKQWPIQEKLAELKTVTPEELQAHVEELFAQCNIQALALGNLYKDDAVRLVESAEELLRMSRSPVNVYESARIPPPSSNVVLQANVPNPNEPNSTISYYIHTGSILAPRNRVTAAFLAQYLREPAFNILRTREQLGYVVDCSHWSSPGQAEGGLRIVIQSERAPAYLEERVDAFLDEMKENLASLSDADFEEHRKGLEKHWQEDPKNMKEEASQYWVQIDNGYLDFYRRKYQTVDPFGSSH